MKKYFLPVNVVPCGQKKNRGWLNKPKLQTGDDSRVCRITQIGFLLDAIKGA